MELRHYTPSKIAFALCSIMALGLLTARWIINGQLAGFFLPLAMVCMMLLRLRVQGLRYSVIIDVLACALLYPLALALPLFWAMYYRVYFAAITLAALVFIGDFYALLFTVISVAAGIFLGLWEREHQIGVRIRDTKAGRLYEMQTLQTDLLAATEKIERMTAVSERARIAREIHDNAGHDIIGAYISLQAVRAGLPAGDAALPLFDAALERLARGTDRIREAVHNLAPITALGVETLREACARFPLLPVAFILHGDTNHVPIYIWNALEACLNEALTNAARHARPLRVTVRLDVTPKLVRLCVENDGIGKYGTSKGLGAGLRNLRYRAASIGGSIAVDAGETYKIVCVLPIQGGTS